MTLQVLTSPQQGIAILADPTQTPVEDRPARFLRIVKAVSIPSRDVRDFDNSAFGRSRNQLMREIIGYVPVEPDGSVLFDVPANVPLAFSVLDENGKRVSERHQNWLQFAPGEVRTCNGCHSQDSEAPHGRSDAEADSINLGALTTGNPFPNSNPALFADLGDTMAQTSGRINGINYPSADIILKISGPILLCKPRPPVLLIVMPIYNLLYLLPLLVPLIGQVCAVYKFIFQSIFNLYCH